MIRMSGRLRWLSKAVHVFLRVCVCRSRLSPVHGGLLLCRSGLQGFVDGCLPIFPTLRLQHINTKEKDHAEATTEVDSSGAAQEFS